MYYRIYNELCYLYTSMKQHYNEADTRSRLNALWKICIYDLCIQQLIIWFEMRVLKIYQYSIQSLTARFFFDIYNKTNPLGPYNQVRVDKSDLGD